MSLLAKSRTAVLSRLSTAYAPALLDQHKVGTMIALFFGVIAVMFWNYFGQPLLDL